jgi:putative transposase
MKELRSYIAKDEKISTRSQCELLGINRSTAYYKPVGESVENLEFMRLIDKHNLDHPTHGVLQIRDFLFLAGFVVNPKRVRRLLRLMGIEAIYPKRNLSKLGHAKYIKPYLLRGLKITRPNQVWGIDITYIAMRHGFMYLVAIIDHYSRYIVEWDVFNSLDAENSLIVLEKAIERNGKPEIINSDQGSQFTCALWTEFVEKEEIKASMDGKGRATDNIYIERFWRTLKQDYVYLNPEDNGTNLFKGIKKFIDYYNTGKPHQGIDSALPVSLYKQAA